MVTKNHTRRLDKTGNTSIYFYMNRTRWETMQGIMGAIVPKCDKDEMLATFLETIDLKYFKKVLENHYKSQKKLMIPFRK